MFVIDQARYDARTRQTLTTWTVIDARRSRSRIIRKTFRVNVYSHAELKDLLGKAGFKIETTWGLLPGRPLRSAQSLAPNHSRAETADQTYQPVR